MNEIIQQTLIDTQKNNINRRIYEDLAREDDWKESKLTLKHVEETVDYAFDHESTSSNITIQDLDKYTLVGKANVTKPYRIQAGTALNWGNKVVGHVLSTELIEEKEEYNIFHVKEFITDEDLKRMICTKPNGFVVSLGTGIEYPNMDHDSPKLIVRKIEIIPKPHDIYLSNKKASIEVSASEPAGRITVEGDTHVLDAVGKLVLQAMEEPTEPAPAKTEKNSLWNRIKKTLTGR